MREGKKKELMVWICLLLLVALSILPIVLKTPRSDEALRNFLEAMEDDEDDDDFLFGDDGDDDLGFYPLEVFSD